MKTFDGVTELARSVGEELGVSEYVKVDQSAIDAFARVTGDLQWIHVDPARAKRELPEGKTIAHGYLTLALLTALSKQVCAVRTEYPILNYGLNRVRFIRPVPEGSRLRLRIKLVAAEQTGAGTRITMENVMEMEGSNKPVLFAENVVLYTHR